MVGEMVKEGIRRWMRWSYYILYYKLADVGKRERIARDEIKEGSEDGK